MLQQAGEMGDLIGDRIAYQLNLDYRQRMEKEIVRVSALPGLTPAQRREMVIKSGVELRSQLGQEIIQAQMGVGRHYESPLDIEYRKAQIDASKARTEYYRSRQGGVGQSNLLSVRKYWTDELKKAVDVAADRHDNDMEAAYKDPTVTRIEKRIREIENQLNPPQVDPDWLQSEGFQEGDFRQPPAPAQTKESFPTAEELIGPPTDEQRDLTMQGAFGRPGLVGPPASAQTSFPVTPGLEKRSTPPRPKTKKEFLATVARLKASPETIERARTYYDKWVGRFKWQ